MLSIIILITFLFAKSSLAQDCKAYYRYGSVDLPHDPRHSGMEQSKGLTALNYAEIQLETDDDLYVKLLTPCFPGYQNVHRVKTLKCTNPNVCTGEWNDDLLQQGVLQFCGDNLKDFSTCQLESKEVKHDWDEATQSIKADDPIGDQCCKENYWSTVCIEWHDGNKKCFCTAHEWFADQVWRLPGETEEQAATRLDVKNSKNMLPVIPGMTETQIAIKELWKKGDASKSWINFHVHGCETNNPHNEEGDEKKENDEGEHKYIPPQFHFLPPFQDNMASEYFNFWANDNAPGSEDIPARSKKSPFIDLTMKKNANGKCAVFVTLGDYPNMEASELVAIDGVDFGCMNDGWTAHPIEVARDFLISLDRFTDSMPKSDGKVNVKVIDPSTNTATTYKAKFTYSYWLTAKSKLETLDTHMLQMMNKCWSGFDAKHSWPPPVMKGNGKTCERDMTGIETSSRVENERTTALNRMTNKVFGAVNFGKHTIYQTGEAAHLNQSSVDWQSGTCVISFSGVTDKDGNPHKCSNTDIVVEADIRETKRCDFEALAAIQEDFMIVLDEMLNGTIPADSSTISSYLTKDAWSSCANIVQQSMKDAYTEDTITTAQCMLEMPNEGCWYTTDKDGVTQIPSKNLDTPYCKDPCCNEDLQDQMCCAASEHKVNLYTPALIPADFVKRCPGMEKEALSEAVTEAIQFADLVTDVKKCFDQSDKVKKDVEKMQKAPRCCLQSVIGEVDWMSNSRAPKSIQMCNNDNDCYSGTCDKPTSSSNSGNSQTATAGASTTACYTTEEYSGMQYFCKPANTDAAAKVGQCLKDFVPVGQEKTKALVARHFGGSVFATDEQIGAGLIGQGSRENCIGDTGYKYDPNNWCQEHTTNADGTTECKRICNSPDDCKTKCLQDMTCNWKPWSHNNTANWLTTATECTSGKSTSTCIMKHPWGWSEDLRRDSKCIANINVRGPEDPANHRFSWDGSGLTDYHRDGPPSIFNQSFCASLGLTYVQNGEHEWPRNYGSCRKINPADITDCLDTCLGSNGFKPTQTFGCYVNTVNGRCDKNSLWARREIDWQLELPHNVKRPGWCMAEMRNFENSNTKIDLNSTEIAALANAGAGAAFPANGLQFQNHDWQAYETWRNIFGTDVHHWGGLSFNKKAYADVICPALGAKVRMIDNGKGRCHESKCFRMDKNETSCARLSLDGWTAGSLHMQFYRWDVSLNEGNGACTSEYVKGYPRYQAMKFADANYLNAFSNDKNNIGKIIFKNNGQSIEGQRNYDSGSYSGYDATRLLVQFQGHWPLSDVRPENGWDVELYDNSDTLKVTTTLSADPIPYRSCEVYNYNCGGDAGADMAYNHCHNCVSLKASKDACEASGSTFHIGRDFEEGRRNTQSKCVESYCNIVGAHSNLPSSYCTEEKLGGRCEGGQGCLGCVKKDRDPSASGREYWGLCIKVLEGADNVQSNCSTTDDVYDATTGLCYNSEKFDSNSCNFSDCGLSTDSTEIEKKLMGANLLNCERDLDTRHCDKDTCVQQGRCHSGAHVEAQVWYRENTQDQASRHKRKLVDHVCVVEKQMDGDDPDSWMDKCPGFDKTLPRVEKHGDHYWDPFIRDHGNLCIYYTDNSKQECDTRGGVWTKTMGVTAEECRNSGFKECQGGRSNRGTHNRNKKECEKCGGQMKSHSFYESGKWITPQMINGSLSWTTRAMAPTNEWKNELEYWKISEAMRGVFDLAWREAQATLNMCLYGRQFGALVKISSLCGANPPEDWKAFVRQDTNVSKSNLIAGAEGNRAGSSSLSNVEFDANSITGDEMATVKVGLAKPSFADGPNETATQKTRRILYSKYRRLTGSPQETINDANCYTVVRNDNNVLVGQLIGGCLSIQANNVNGSVKGCAAINPKIKKFSEFTVKDFVIRTKDTTTDAFKYKPMGIAVNDIKTHFCSNMTVTQTVCPALLVSGWESKTTDTGSGECSALRTLLDGMNAGPDLSILYYVGGGLLGMVVGMVLIMLYLSHLSASDERKKVKEGQQKGIEMA
eukprot:g2666.t1